jgi:hypothetical protein
MYSITTFEHLCITDMAAVRGSNNQVYTSVQRILIQEANLLLGWPKVRTLGHLQMVRDETLLHQDETQKQVLTSDDLKWLTELLSWEHHRKPELLP